MINVSLNNLSLIEIPANQTIRGIEDYVLIQADGTPVHGFDMYCRKLMKDHEYGTAINYIGHVVKFLDYLSEVATVAPAHGIDFVDALFLSEVIGAYRDFLQSGVHNESDLIREVAVNLSRAPLKQSSTVPHIAAVNGYLLYSEEIHMRLLELDGIEELGLISTDRLFPDAGKLVPIESGQKIAMLQKNVLSGVMAGGPKLKRLSALSYGKTTQQKYEGLKDFPAHKFVNLIEDGFNNYRDKAYYCLLGASGIRQCEADVITFADLDFENEEVHVIAPKSRSLQDYNHYLSVQEIKKIPWKGRNTKYTLLIEPWGAMFWHYYSLYMQHEWTPSKDHPFVFQIIRGKNKGKPFFTSCKSSIRKTFKKAVNSIGLTALYSSLSDEYPGHSLRHMYGVFLRNYYPNPRGGFGLDSDIIQSIMGHVSADSTLKYARYDLNKLRTQQIVSQLMLSSPSELKIQATIEVLEDKLELLKSHLPNNSESAKALAHESGAFL
jgi:integrase